VSEGALPGSNGATDRQRPGAPGSVRTADHTLPNAPHPQPGAVDATFGAPLGWTVAGPEVSVITLAVTGGATAGLLLAARGPPPPARGPGGGGPPGAPPPPPRRPPPHD
jgi:hypothetical protein